MPYHTTLYQALTLLASLTCTRSALGDQSEQGTAVRGMLDFVRHGEEGVRR